MFLVLLILILVGTPFIISLISAIAIEYLQKLVYNINDYDYFVYNTGSFSKYVARFGIVTGSIIGLFLVQRIFGRKQNQNLKYLVFILLTVNLIGIIVAVPRFYFLSSNGISTGKVNFSGIEFQSWDQVEKVHIRYQREKRGVSGGFIYKFHFDNKDTLNALIDNDSPQTKIDKLKEICFSPDNLTMYLSNSLTVFSRRDLVFDESLVLLLTERRKKGVPIQWS